MYVKYNITDYGLRATEGDVMIIISHCCSSMQYCVAR